MKVEVFLDWENRNSKGEVISNHHQKCNSYVLAMADLLYVQMSQQTTAIKDITGASPNVAADALAFKVTTASRGIRVGTGTTATTLIDNVLETPIVDGGGAGQLSYAATTSYSAPATVGSTRKFTLSRTFTNNSGGDITVTEVVLYVDSGASGNVGLCVERTLSTNLIANTASATATYTISITV